MSQHGYGHNVLRELLFFAVRLLVGAYPAGSVPHDDVQTLYFPNHTSHLDALTLLAALRLRSRASTRPVAARDYWCGSKPRRWIAEHVLDVVFIDRARQADEDPLAPVRQALADGDSLIFFPEGTRHEGGLPGDFKSGLYHLARDFSRVQFTPVYLENLHRILPKASLLPVPLINKVHFGAPVSWVPGESKADFLTRARKAVCALSPGH